jgi:flagellar protein FlaG
MEQISINSVAAVPTRSPVETGSAAAAGRTLNRAVSTAVSDLNNAGFPGAGRELTFSVDQVTKAPVIKVIDTETREVISQIPSAYLLQIAADNTNNGRDSG